MILSGGFSGVNVIVAMRNRVRKINDHKKLINIVGSVNTLNAVMSPMHQMVIKIGTDIFFTGRFCRKVSFMVNPSLFSIY